MPLTTCPSYAPTRRMVCQRLLLRRLERTSVSKTRSGTWDLCSRMQGLSDRVRRMPYILVQQTEPNFSKLPRDPIAKRPFQFSDASGVTSPLWVVTRMGEPRGLIRHDDHRKRIYRNVLAFVGDSHTHTHTPHSLFKLSAPLTLSLLLHPHSIAKYGRPPPSPSAVHLCHLPLYSFIIFLHHQHQSLGSLLSPPSPPPSSLYFSKIFFIICRKFFSHLFFCLPCPDQSSGASPSLSTQQT